MECSLKVIAERLFYFLSSAALGCSGHSIATDTASSPAPAVLTATDPRWQDAFEQASDLLMIIRPQALRHDGVYGPLLSRGIELAREHSPIALATGALDVMLDADEVVIGVRFGARPELRTSQEPIDDLIVVVRGVRAEIDPAHLVDEGGAPLWAPGPNAPAADVRELLRVHEEGGIDASLFELPGRNWLMATGPARMRVREAFARRSSSMTYPRERPMRAQSHTLDDVDPHALATARISGAALRARVASLRPPGLLAPVARDLAALTLALSPGTDAVVRATLQYKSEDPLDVADATVRGVIRALLAAKPDEYAWLRTAVVARGPSRVLVTAPLPERLLRGLLHPLSPGPLTDAPAAH